VAKLTNPTLIKICFVHMDKHRFDAHYMPIIPKSLRPFARAPARLNRLAPFGDFGRRRNVRPAAA
jgi:hypothetical protein